MHFLPFNHRLNLTVVIVYLFGLKGLSSQARAYGFSSRAGAKSTLFGACIGLIEDILSGAGIGPNLFSKGIIGFVSLAIFSGVVFQWTYFWGGVVLFGLTIFDGLMFTGVRVFFANQHIDGFVFLQGIAVQAAINAVFGIIFRPRH